MNQNLSNFREYVKSAAITFISTFAVAFVPFLGNDNFKESLLISALLAAVRAGFKAVLEMLAVIRPTETLRD